MKTSIIKTGFLTFFLSGAFLMLCYPNTFQLNNADKLVSKSDEFNNPASLIEWKFFHNENKLPNKIKNMSFDKANSCLYIEPYSACWYSGYYGIYFYKEIEGDFIITAKIKVEGKINDLPNDKWSIAGILIRQPLDTSIALSERKENWVYINSGRGKNPEWVLVSCQSLIDG